MTDMIKTPSHYTTHPSGIECIEITKHMGFCLGNVFKYIWRAPYKGQQLKDLKKAREYINYEIDKLEKEEKDDAMVTALLLQVTEGGTK